ncbi:transporter substrate-binding domain-containing protein [Desulfovibrio cuneatus]|uniref:transporter substrate-binding domain-containing protein n=1 Tax=Desulfovibrio cuneatus TaxID=159728 RepID=UPI0004122F1E|nr:transporter substrate-binding domain-containing protein [Desulfovibrio cuneatus]
MRILFFVLLLFCIPTSVIAAQKPIRVAIDVPYPPFAYYNDNKELTGFDVDFTHAICAEMKRDCEIVIMPFDQVIPSIMDGSVDIGVVGMGTLPGREELVDFSDRYYRSHSVFVERPGTVTAVTPAALKGKRIGVQAGTVQEVHLKEVYKDSVLVIKDLYEEVYDDLKKGAVDVILTDGLPAYAYLKSKEGSQLEAVGGPVTAEILTGASFVTVSKKQPELRQDINKAIQAIRKSGQYGKINRKYFDFNIF